MVAAAVKMSVVLLVTVMDCVWFQDGDYEPVESLPYFHSCLSKEEAVEKLMLGMCLFFYCYEREREEEKKREKKRHNMNIGRSSIEFCSSAAA